MRTEGEKADKVSFIENKIFAADSNFLKIFTFPLIYGDPETALSQANAIVLTQSTSKKYFGEADPIGKTLTIRVPWGAENNYEVRGVVADVPQKSKFRFNFLITPSPLHANDFWAFPAYSTYLLLKEKAAPAELSKKLTSTINQTAPLKSTNREVVVSLESFANTQLSGTEYLLVAVGLFILLISWVNYINQIIAQSYGRIKNVGILSIMGASRTNLKSQFLVESSLVCLISLALIISIYWSIEPFLQSFTNGHLLPLIGDSSLINFGFLAVFIIGIALAAAIPTVVLFSQNFTLALRNRYSAKVGSMGLRKALVAVQFSISMILIIGVFVITNQLEYMKDQDKGINMENTTDGLQIQ